MITFQSDPGLNEPAAPIDTTLVPSIVQITGAPSSLGHRMSDTLGPLWVDAVEKVSAKASRRRLANPAAAGALVI